MCWVLVRVAGCGQRRGDLGAFCLQGQAATASQSCAIQPWGGPCCCPTPSAPLSYHSHCRLLSLSLPTKTKPQRRRKNRKVVEPQVKVQSAAVDMVTGKTPASPVGEVETLVVQVLGIFFFLLLTEGLVLAGSVSVVCCQ